MVLIANIRRHSTSDSRAVVFHNSYATDWQITNHKSDSAFANRHIRLGTRMMEILSFALHNGSDAISKALR